MEITKIDDRTEIIIDTLKMEKWNSIDNRRKLKIRNYIVEQNLRVKNDNSKITKVLYYGIPTSVQIKDNDTLNIELNLDNNFSEERSPVLHDYPVREKTFDLLSLERNTGIKNMTIFFPETSQYANLEISTSYSLVYIYPILNGLKTKFAEKESDKKKLMEYEDRIIIMNQYKK